MQQRPASDITDIVIDDEFKHLLPFLDPESFAALEVDILEHGLRDALVLWEGHDILIDGHNRYEIIKKHNLPFSVTYMQFDSRDDVLIWMVTTQIARRNLSPLALSHFRGLHYMADKRILGSNRHVQRDQSGQIVHSSGPTAARLADEYNIDPRTIRRDAQVAQGINVIGEASVDAKRKILAGAVPIARTKLTTLLSESPEYVEEVATAIEDGTYNWRQSMTQSPDGEGEEGESGGGSPAALSPQAISTITNDIRRTFTRELRSLTSNDDTNNPAAAKPVLRAYIASLEELYQRL
ncbi:MAG: hypothetical protein FWC99_06445 [Coriobacteriia bacterium]|nr:hypothetical protein [Coriobacteriia bacterium]